MPYTIEKLRELEERATKGPWCIGMRNGHNASNIYAHTSTRKQNPEHFDPVICAVMGIPLHKTVYEIEQGPSLCNASLIAYLRTHLPEIIADLEELEERREKEKA